jgi:hypothetical protein
VSDIPMAEWEAILATPMPEPLDNDLDDSEGSDRHIGPSSIAEDKHVSGDGGRTLSSDANGAPVLAEIKSVQERQTSTDICAMTSYFNPMGYTSRRRNYQLFRDALRRQGLPLATIELAFTPGDGYV